MVSSYAFDPLKCIALIRWGPPPSGILKFNFDKSFARNPQLARIGEDYCDSVSSVFTYFIFSGSTRYCLVNEAEMSVLRTCLQ